MSTTTENYARSAGYADAAYGIHQPQENYSEDELRAYNEGQQQQRRHSRR